MSETWQAWAPKLAKYYAELLRNSSANANRHLHALGSVLRYGHTADLSVLDVDLKQVLSRNALVLNLGRKPGGDGIEWEEDPSEEDESRETDEEAEVDPRLAAGFERTRSALLRIYRKQKSDPHNRETTIGLPIVGSKLGNTRVSGALLYWDVDMKYDPGVQRLILSRRNSSPTLNVRLLERFTADPEELNQLREKVLPQLLADDTGPAMVERVLKTVRGSVEALRELEVFQTDDPQALPAFLQELNGLGTGDKPRVLYSPVVVNGPRSFAHLLDDLDAISRLSEVDGRSVLSTVIGDIPEGIGEVDAPDLPFGETSDGGRPLWFPFPSNKAQRRVARSATRARVLTVQGPPGTGKSLTIANLVCHLVTEGNTVLVASHQLKALEVLAAKLPPIDYLAMPVLRGDKESMARLKTQLEQTQAADPSALAEARDTLRAAEEYLHRHDRELRRLARRYTELKQLEHEGYDRHHRYGELRQHDHIDPADELDADRAQQTSAALREWAELTKDLAPALDDFRALFRPGGERTPRAEEQHLAEALRALCELANALRREASPGARALLEAIRSGRGDGDEQEQHLERMRTWLVSEAGSLEEQLAALGEPHVDDALLRRWYEAVRRLGIDEADRISAEAEGAKQFMAEADITADDIPDLSAVSHAELLRVLETLEDSRGSLLRWHLGPEIRRARRFLADSGFPRPRRRRFVQDGARARQALEWHQRSRRLDRLWDELGAVLPLSEDLRRSEWKGRALDAKGRVAERVARVLEELRAVPLIGSGNETLLRHLSFSLVAADRAAMASRIEEVIARLRRFRLTVELEGRLAIPGAWGETIHELIKGVRAGELSDEESYAFEKVGALVDHYPEFRRLIDLETVELRPLPRTRRAIREVIAQEGTVPGWLERAQLAVDAYRLGALLRQSLAADPDDLTAISRSLQEGQEKRRKILEEIIRRKRVVAVAEAVQDPHHAIALRSLRSLLTRTRRTDSLLALRRGIDYEAVLRVFPAWICTIDDIARLFPMKAGLFDVLIVDEASQCAQATALPLAYRAKRMIVVGDEKQLQPATSRFISQSVIDTLQRKLEIDQHPRAVFLNGKDSLLELAESCRQHREFLNEHFRCDPEIIRWSNHRFYNDALQIMTHRRAGSFAPPLRIVQLTDADEDPERKVNRAEAEAVVQEVHRLIESGEADRLTIGVISPFRQQADLLHDLLYREFANMPEALAGHRITASTADGFQGDERDIILYSFRYGPSSPPGVISAIQREEERLNVAFTRAKRLGICFISSPLERFPQGAIRDFLSHAIAAQNRAVGGAFRPDRPDRFDSEFERKVCTQLRDRSLRVTTQEPCTGHFIDLIVEDDEGRVLAVECDGDWKEDDYGRLRPEDYQRQDIIERAGWVIHRVSGRRYFVNPEHEIDRIVEQLQKQPTAEDREIAIGPRLRPVPAVELEMEQRVEKEIESVGPGVVGADEVDKRDHRDTSRPQSAPAISGHRGGPTGPRTARDELAFPLDAEEPAMLVKKLLRWLMMRPNSPEGSAIDELQEIIEQISTGEGLPATRTAYLDELWKSARRQGFDPARVELPEVFGKGSDEGTG